MGAGQILKILIIFTLLGIFLNILFSTLNSSNISVIDSQCAIKCGICNANWPTLNSTFAKPEEGCGNASSFAASSCQKFCKASSLHCELQEGSQECLDYATGCYEAAEKESGQNQTALTEKLDQCTKELSSK